jgi:hypothetical protein
VIAPCNSFVLLPFVRAGTSFAGQYDTCTQHCHCFCQRSHLFSLRACADLFVPPNADAVSEAVRKVGPILLALAVFAAGSRDCWRICLAGQRVMQFTQRSLEASFSLALLLCAVLGVDVGAAHYELQRHAGRYE